MSKEDDLSAGTSSRPCCSCGKIFLLPHNQRWELHHLATGCILRLVLGLLLVLTFVLVGGTLLCDQYYGSEECRQLWREFITMATQGLESLGIKLPGP